MKRILPHLNRDRSVIRNLTYSRQRLEKERPALAI
jgi:hypothetical protein